MNGGIETTENTDEGGQCQPENDDEAPGVQGNAEDNIGDDNVLESCGIVITVPQAIR